MSNKLKKALLTAALVMFGLINVGTPYDDEDYTVDEYRVKAGDNFWYITENYRNKDARDLYLLEYQDEVRELNPWLKESHNQLHVGDVIKVRYIRKEVAQ